MSQSPTKDLSIGDFVLVQAGPFLFGEEQELRYLPPYRIRRFPVTVSEYARFIEDTRHEPPESWDSPKAPADRQDHPVTCVSFLDAQEFARWEGKDIPTEEQWEKAARGTDGRSYPWGDAFNVRLLNSRAAKKRGTTPVNAYSGAESPFGAFDMAGNVWEWTSTWYDGSELMVLKGGCHALTKEYAKVTSRHYNEPGFGNNLTGFRTIENL